MKVCIMITVDVDPEGIRAYKHEYPEHRHETPAQLLVREAVAGWEVEDLLSDNGGDYKWTEVPMAREENI